MSRENYKPKLLNFFEANPNNAYEFNEIHKNIGGDYCYLWLDLQYLVRCKIVVSAIPGLNGGRKKTYFKRI